MSSGQRRSLPARTCEVLATALDDAGAGVGTPPELGIAVHVADLLPGERAEVALDHASPHKAAAWAHVIRRLGDASADRVAPACPAFGRCGGCAWQHLAYPAQLAHKHARIVAALAGAGVASDVAVAPVRPSPQTLGYRNKGKYVVGRHGERLVFGAYAPRSHVVVDTLGCQIVAPIIDEVAAWLRGAADEVGLEPYAEGTRTGELRYAIVREAGGDVLVVLVTVSNVARVKLARVATALARHPAVRGVVVIENDRRDGAIVPSGSTARVLHGNATLADTLAGVPVELGASEFLQVNRPQAAAMYARVAELAEVTPATRAIDLFAGLGGISLALARAGAAEVVAVEIDAEAVAQLRRAADRAHLPITPLAGDARDLPAALRARLPTGADLVVVNPPRRGLDEAARAIVVGIDAPTVLYVSCGPDSLGRDLAAFAPRYRVDAIEPFDLMPGTAQVETVVRLRRLPDAKPSPTA